jgi:hypothetical protein
MLIVFPACSKKEEAPQSGTQKVKKYAPDYKVITDDKLEHWLNASERVGDFIRRYALEEEDVASKEDFMFIAHSSPRTEAALTSLFKGLELKQGEFWWILERLDEAKRYIEIKALEDIQNKRIDMILAAGRDEKAATEKALAKEMDEERKKELVRRLDIINAKFSELSSLKGHTTPKKVGVEPANVELYGRNKDRIEAAIKKMWKVKPGGRAEMARDKGIPGH